MIPREEEEDVVFHERSIFSPKSPERLSSLSHRKLQELNDQGCNLSFQSSPYSRKAEIQISVKGIEKLLKSLNPHKAGGPDQFKHIVLQTLHAELALILQVIFQKSLDSGKLLHILKEANVCTIFKKGDKSYPANYHPISLTRFFVQSARTHSRIQLNIWLIPTYYLSCNRGSGIRGPARTIW